MEGKEGLDERAFADAELELRNLEIFLPVWEPKRAAESVSIDEDDSAILRALQKFAPQLCDQYAIVEETGIARKSVGIRLNRLISEGLASRPLGDRKGATITPQGSTFIAKLPTPK